MILGAKEIYRLIKENKLVVRPLFDDAIRENGVGLRIGGEYAVYTHSGIVVNPCKLNDSEMRRLFRTVSALSEELSNEDEIPIPPKSFVLLTTYEYVKLPDDVVGLVNLRSTLARLGLIILPTIIDAGFEGNVTIEAVNASSNTIVLKKFMRFLHVVFARTEGAVPYEGEYKGQTGVRPPKGLKKEC